MINIPVVDMTKENGPAELDAILKSTMSSSDYRNDRDRPYNGQPQTDQGERGKQEITGLTMRDVCDCLAQGFLRSVDPDVPEQQELCMKTVETDKEFIGTEYEKKGTWRYSDLYKIDFTHVDPMAIIQNTTCMIEHMMGIFPNVPKLTVETATRELFGDDLNIINP